ncbi:MAG: signal peptide peptidase SppA [Rikenellaceae bacterium]
MGKFFKNLFISLAAFLTATLLFVLLLTIGAAVAITALTPEVEPLKKGTVLEINMSELFVDSPQSPSLIDLKGFVFGSTPQISTLSMLRALEFAASDPNITAISLRMDGAEYLPLATAEELRTALEEFLEVSGKPIFAYAEGYSQVEYYLSTVADKIFIHPLGHIEWQGVSMNTLFYGDLLKSIGADVEVFRPAACRFKSAVEPYTRSSMSEESREQSSRLVNILWDGVVGQVAQSRAISEQTLRRVADEVVVVEADEAKQLGFVDDVLYEDHYIAQLEEAGIALDKGKMRRITLGRYATRIDPNSDLMGDDLIDMGGNKIAVIYVDGTIIDGVSEVGGSSGDSYVGSTTIVNQLRRVRNDDNIKGVVVRVNSPGGSAMAADVMWREMDLLKDEKMVVISMGSYAASGGYYISAPADAILADRYTLTGSIGVYGMMVAYEEALSRHLHINFDGVGSSSSSDFCRVPRKITPIERAAMMRSVDQVYDSFTSKVSKGRNLPIGVVNALSGGQVWSGVEAESCGLVDGVGGLKMALNLIVDRCGLDGSEYKIIEVSETPDEFEMLLKSLGVRLQSSPFNSILSLMGRERSQISADLRALTSSSGIMMHTPERLDF